MLAMAGLLGCGGAKTATSTAPAAPVADLPGSPAQARRFLTQATLGPNDADLAAVTASGYSAWLDTQMSLPVSGTFLAYLDQRNAMFQADNAGKTTGLRSLGANQLYETFYAHAATAPDSVRQRAAFALSQILVVSMQNSSVAFHIRSAASYYDVLQADVFTNYRTLLQDVTLHPAMDQKVVLVGAAAYQPQPVKTLASPATSSWV